VVSNNISQEVQLEMSGVIMPQERAKHVTAQGLIDQLFKLLSLSSIRFR